MTTAEIREKLHYVDATREKRNLLASFILENNTGIEALLEFIQEDAPPLSNRASWVLEFVAIRKRALLYPHLDKFTSMIGNLRLDSSIRPMAKICELLVEAYSTEPGHPIAKILTGRHREHIAEACFDWLIGPYKIAPQAYSMYCLYLLGQEFDWIWPELRSVLERNYGEGSPGYQARARRILGLLPPQ